MQWNLAEVGCLWKGRDKNGNAILTGKVLGMLETWADEE